MNMRIGILLAAAIVLLPAGVPVFGQGPGFGGNAESFEPTLLVDWAAFQSAQPAKTRLDIYYQVYNFGLQFLPDGKEFAASYDINALVYDDGGDQVSSYERTRQVRVASLAQTRSKFDYRTSQFNLDLPPGKYTVKFTLTDRGSKTSVAREIKANLPQLKASQPLLSRVEFVQSVSQKSDSDGVFDKGNRVVIPSVSRAFGGDDDTRLLFYLELYRGADSLDRTVLETVIRHRSKGMVYRDTVHVAIDEPVIRQLREISIADMPPGDYELEITLRGRRMKELDKQREMFSVLWTQEALLKLDWKTAVSQISYIAVPNELSQIKKAKTYEERRVAFDGFWTQRDPSIGTEENETKREFYRRINVANRQFSNMRREGWRTDRGRIYIINGEPDEIDDEPYAINSVPYQVWHYYRNGKYRRFMFVDKDEDGDYRLQYPYDGLNQRPDF
jgi:GWxTD domain-containing protein